MKGLVVAGVLVSASLLLGTPASATLADKYRQQGLSYREQERYSEAIAAFEQAVALEPTNLSGKVLLGWTQHKAKQNAAAAKTLLQALQLNPFNVQTLNALGIVYLVEGRLTAAITAHAWAATLQPTNEIPSYNLSLAFERVRQYNFAIATAKTAARLEPTNPHPFVALAIAHWGNGENAQAQQAYRQALSVDPRYSDAAFLNYLDEAGFSQDQIERSKLVLQTVR
ncbi:tetratricopeptide repeat protein [Leptolyngbya sp. FACHB-321]|uniref:tetratricopeptide repeat protein n=1 Tax=Leptolyngbya sp. FACHB-321 TaxID=2692807 RepID=UPI001683F057|nr:tetratricopeptide repeat protein [Leptolyngbya sp. FACHB-321]MBD2037036.1 tetratricopeptide repeat protein [Leptolyngbya sp. FACHB-321]